MNGWGDELDEVTVARSCNVSLSLSSLMELEARAISVDVCEHVRSNGKVPSHAAFFFQSIMRVVYYTHHSTQKHALF